MDKENEHEIRRKRQGFRAKLGTRLRRFLPKLMITLAIAILFSQFVMGAVTITDTEITGITSLNATGGVLYLDSINYIQSIMGLKGEGSGLTNVTAYSINWNNVTNQPFIRQDDQSVNTSDGVTFATVNTGHGANELYDMNQNVQTTSDVTFNGIVSSTSSNASDFYDDGTNLNDKFVDESGDTMTGTLTINQNSDAKGLFIDQNGNGLGVDIDNDGTTYALRIDQADGATRNAFQIVGNAPSAGSSDYNGYLVSFRNSDTVGGNLYLTNDGTREGLFIDQNGNGDALSIDNAGTADSISITQNGTGAGLYIDHNGNGRALEIVSVSTSQALFVDYGGTGYAMYTNIGTKADRNALHITGDGPSGSNYYDGYLVSMNQANNSNSGGIYLTNEGTNEGLYIDQNGNGDALSIDNAGTADSISITQNGNTCTINVDANNICDAGTEIAEDNSIALCLVCS